MNVNFVESNPIPVKAAMALMGLLEPVYRLPLVPPSPANLARIEKVLEAVGLWRGSVPLQAEIEALFDRKPAAYTGRALPPVRRIQDGAERGPRARRRARPRARPPAGA